MAPQWRVNGVAVSLPGCAGVSMRAPGSGEKNAAPDARAPTRFRIQMTPDLSNRAALAMPVAFAKRAALVILVGGSLAACSGMGTVVDDSDPEAELPNLSMGRSIMEGLGAVPSRRIPINYTTRGPLVVPSDTTTLAQPEDASAVTAQADWPLDPDVESTRLLREAAARETARGDKGELIPSSELLAQRSPPPASRPSIERDPARPLLPSQLKAMPSLSSSNLYDAQGRPVRRALTEPPVAYLEPAPGAPVMIPEEPPKKRKGILSWMSW
jgi:hypothetical protein